MIRSFGCRKVSLHHSCPLPRLLAKRRAIPVGYHHMGTFLGQEVGDCFPDPVSSGGNSCSLSLDLNVHSTLLAHVRLRVVRELECS